MPGMCGCLANAHRDSQMCNGRKDLGLASDRGWPATMSVGQRLCLWEHLSTMGVWHKGKGMRREEGSL